MFTLLNMVVLFFILSFLLQKINLASELLGTNVAYRQKAILNGCEKDVNQWVDGDRIIGYDNTPLGCEISTLITLHFGRNASIQSVILYLGDASTSPLASSIDRFGAFFGPRAYCGEFPHKIDDIPQKRKPLQLNCMFLTEVFDQMLINIRSPLILAEIEALSFSTEDNTNGVTIYRGCYKDFDRSNSTPFTDFWACKSFCWDKLLYLMAIKGDLCLCSNDYLDTDLSPLSECDVKCASADNYYCGGENGYSVYLLGFQLPGFDFRLALIDPSIAVKLENNSLQDCISRCISSYYMWIQDDMCACLNDRDSHRNPDVNVKNCSVRCPGDDQAICGCENGGHLYATCMHDKYDLLPCFKLLQCVGDAFDEHGICISGCKPGFRGVHCLEADYSDPDVIKPTEPRTDLASLKSSKSGGDLASSKSGDDLESSKSGESLTTLDPGVVTKSSAVQVSDAPKPVPGTELEEQKARIQTSKFSRKSLSYFLLIIAFVVDL